MQTFSCTVNRVAEWKVNIAAVSIADCVNQSAINAWLPDNTNLPFLTKKNSAK